MYLDQHRIAGPSANGHWGPVLLRVQVDRGEIVRDGREVPCDEFGHWHATPAAKQPAARAVIWAPRA